MSANEYDKLQLLKLLAGEDGQSETPDCGGCTLCTGASAAGGNTYTEDELLTILRAYGGDARRAAYAVLLRKAEQSDIRFPSGLQLPNQSEYYLRLARHVRTNATRTVPRADGV